jgi:hypothetical protein
MTELRSIDYEAHAYLYRHRCMVLKDAPYTQPAQLGWDESPAEREFDAGVRHIVLGFASHRFPVLEGQTIEIVAPGADALGPPRSGRLREHAAAAPELLRGDRCVYICGLRGLEDGVLQPLEQAGTPAGIDWSALCTRDGSMKAASMSRRIEGAMRGRRHGQLAGRK